MADTFDAVAPRVSSPEPGALAPWLAPDFLPAKPQATGYGYTTDPRTGNFVGRLSWAELVEVAPSRLRAASALVWTPESERMLRPAELRDLRPFLMRDRGRTHWFYGAQGILMLVLSAALAMWFAPESAVVLALSLFGAACLASAWLRWADQRRTTADVEVHRIARHEHWAACQSAVPAVILTLPLALGSIIPFGDLSPEEWKATVTAWGLPAGTRVTEAPWRLLTYGAMNPWGPSLLALVGSAWSAARSAAHLSLLPVAFVIALAAGGAAHAVMPTTNSLAGPGPGVWGVIGFAALVVMRRRDVLPSSVIRSLCEATFVLAIVGLTLKPQPIDWSSSLAGAAAGAILAWATDGQRSNRLWAPSRALRVAGWALSLAFALVTIVVTAGAYRIWRR